MQMQHQRIVPIYIEDEVKQSYLDYSMSVIVSRALPDVRDGLKPSQRRILMAMHDLNLEPGRAHRKCAKIAGDTSGNYHPHGEAVIYPTLARMAQDFNMRYTLVDGQGNFGCFTGDTKVKLLDGTDRSFEELARMYGPDEVFYVYSVDHEGKVVVGEGRNSRVSRQDAEVIELELDSGEVIRCTPDHRFMLRDGSYKQAQDLTTDDSLMPGYDGKLKYQNPNVKTAPCPTSTEEVGGVLSFELCHLTFPDRIVAKRFLKERFDVYDITVESHHNFLLSSGVFVHNSIDGDPPGAMRYTEARMAAPAVELLADLEKDTVDFVPNYDDTRKEPVVLPGKFPNLICNGCSGIAVGMATNIPPHNLSEVVDALLALIEDSELDCDGLMRYVSGPDFPTGGIIYGIEGVQTAYRTGRGRVVIRARATIEKLKNGRENIVITEIPFMVTKASLIENIADLVRQKKIEGISDLRDESDREGLRIVIELRRDAYASVILNQLYTRTRLQNSFGVIMLALVDGQPVTLNLKEVLAYFLEHRHRVVVRRTQFELDRAQKRAHIVEGLRVALDHMDRVIALIRKARDREAAREGLMEQFRLSEAQVDAILDMRLQRLTGLERRRVGDEYLGLIKEITRLEGILMSRPQRMAIIRSELEALREKYGDDRRTEVIASAEEFSIEDLIAEENMVITISHAGYIKRTPIATYRRQRRGGRGGTGMTTRDEDFVEHLFIASTHSYILFLTERGHCYWLKVHEIPEAGRVARGRSVANLLEMGREETIAAIVPVREFDEEHFLLMATQQGLVKKTVLSAYGRPRRDGIVAVDIVSGDRLIEAKLTDGTQDVILATRRGQSIRFRESDVRAMGRATRGVTGISLRDGDEVVSMVAVKRQGTLIMVCRNGYGKRTPVQDYPVIRRGGKGVIGIKTTDRNGELIAAKEVVDNDELMIISQGGILIRLPIRDVSVIGRNTQGVRLIHLDPEDLVVDVTYIMTDGAQERELEEEAEEAVEESADAHHPEAVSDEAADASETDDQNGGSQVALDLFATGSSEDEGEQ